MRLSTLVPDLLKLVLPEPAGDRHDRDGTLERLERIIGQCGVDRPRPVVAAFADQLPHLRTRIDLDVRAAYDGDPACVSEAEAAWCYPGVRAVAVHRVAHELLRAGVPLLPRLIGEHVHGETGIDIHPGARIGGSFFIDHGTGVVIGSTAVIGDHVKLYQGVTLGAVSVPHRSEAGRKRHPTLEDHVTVYAGATVLGGDTVIGAGSVIGAGVFLAESIPPQHIVTNPRPVISLRPNPQRPPLSYVI